MVEYRQIEEFCCEERQRNERMKKENEHVVLNLHELNVYTMQLLFSH